MTIQRALLWAFLLVGATPTLLLALLTFDRASRALQQEIEQGMTAQASALLSDVDRLMFERLQNASTWARSEVMQDLQVGDVDKRIAAFLQGLTRGYGGLYHELLVVGNNGRVVASSDPASIGTVASSSNAWQRLEWAGAAVLVELPNGAIASHRGNETDQPVLSLKLRASVPSAFGQPALGELQLRLDWSQVDRLLDQAAGAGRLVALLDAQGRVLAGSKALLSQWPRLGVAPGVFDGLGAPQRWPGTVQLDNGRKLLAGVGESRAFAGFEGLGWRVMVLVPHAQALAPVWRLAAALALLLSLVLVVTVLASRAVSRAIARPIVALTEFSRRHSPGAPPLAPLQPHQPMSLDPVAQRRTFHPVNEVAEVVELQRAFVQMVQDIEQSQQQLARATALAAVGEMSAVIAHEVRTPLGIMLSSAQMLRREPGLGDEGRELAGYIESETARLGRLVSTMLESTRPRPPQLVATQLPDLIDHAVGLLSAQAQKKSVQVNTSQAQTPITLLCDGEQLTQVLLNLTLNALQMLPPGGRVEISTRLLGAVHDQIEIEIADNGPGIAPQARARLFEAFYFQREGGIGLGLAVVQSIVQAHRGQITAGDSALGGAAFRIVLPLQTKIDEQAARHEADAAITSAGTTTHTPA